MNIQSILKNLQNNIFNTLYFCFILLLPFIYSNEIIDPVLIPRQVFLSLFLLVVTFIIGYKIQRKKLIADFSFVKQPLPILLFLLLFIHLISFSQSIAITESKYVLSKLAIEILFFIITSYLIIQKQLDLKIVAKSLIILGFISVFIACYQLIILLKSEKRLSENIYSVISIYANKNLLASILFLIFPFIINPIGLSKLWKALSILLALLILSLNGIIQTKAFIVAFLVFFLIYVFFIIRYRKHNPNNSYVKVILFSISILLIIASIFAYQNKERFSDVFKNSASSRFFIWENSIDVIKENFIGGVGAGNWQVHFPKHGLDKFTAEVNTGITTFQRPHNDFLWVFCETGIVGILLYVSVFIVVLFYIIKLLKKGKDSEYIGLYFSFFATIVGYMIIAFVDFPLERIEHQVLLYLIFAILMAHYFNHFVTHYKPKTLIVKRPLLLVLLLLPIWFSLVVSINRYSGEFHTQRIYKAHHQANWGMMIRESDKAINNYYSMDPMSAPIEWYKGVALFSLGNINDARISFENAYSIHPFNIHVLNNLASCYEKLGNHQRAVDTYQTALGISSNFEEARLNLAAVFYNMKNYQKAFETIDKCSVSSTDSKYKIFLSVIINSWVDELLLQKKIKLSQEKIIAIKSNKDKIIEIYFDAKSKNVSFEELILNF